tara:strand:+ start:4640 stop:4813 length:174 start_codon:yes stop_codon:yes gene_type:complete
MTNVNDKKVKVKDQIKELRAELRKMHLSVTEELLMPDPLDVKNIMKKMEELLKIIDE